MLHFLHSTHTLLQLTKFTNKSFLTYLDAREALNRATNPPPTSDWSSDCIVLASFSKTFPHHSTTTTSDNLYFGVRNIASSTTAASSQQQLPPTTTATMKRNVVIFLIILILFILIALIGYIIYYLQTRMGTGVSNSTTSGSETSEV
ncbi:hypothetical protein B0J11DRAFT_616776 [Dendryphion nanum]|uniref:Uncharacterized protein n=1 Tax=Dendryphion nanum TaxID=256645 RepID=A0A9P9DFM7_9PLEO|nr:hypothetical protein B0J11DRAFT_616776 [Dendryphion nanum]